MKTESRRGASAVRCYLTEAILPYYIIHQTAIVVVAYEVSKLRLPSSSRSRAES
jgi:hypothetical protein